MNEKNQGNKGDYIPKTQKESLKNCKKLHRTAGKHRETERQRKVGNSLQLLIRKDLKAFSLKACSLFSLLLEFLAIALR
jgi:hypothetical protein